MESDDGNITERTVCRARPSYSCRSIYQELRPRRTSVPVEARRIVGSFAMTGQSLGAKATLKSKARDHKEDSCLTIGSTSRSQGEQAKAIRAIIFMKRTGRNTIRTTS